MGHALLKSTELYLRLAPDRFLKPLFRLQEPANRSTAVQRIAQTVEGKMSRPLEKTSDRFYKLALIANQVASEAAPEVLTAA
jgi:hypothetical protein